MDPMTTSALIGGGASLLGSIFGKGNKKPAPKYSNEAQDVLFGDLSSMLANYGSPVIPALASRGLGGAYKGMFGDDSSSITNPYHLAVGDQEDGGGAGFNLNTLNPAAGPISAHGFGFGGGNLGRYTAGSPNAWNRRPFFGA